MRYQRLILEAGPNAVTLRFHPRLTVVAGLGRAERESLVAELLGALAGGRTGAHLEILEDGGRRLAIMHPETGEGDRVVESETGRDVTLEFTRADGRMDVLGRYGLTLEAARRRSRLSATDVAAVSRADALVNTLAAVDQVRLWAVAEQVKETDARLKAEAESIGAAPEDAPVIEEIERRHQEFEAAQARHEDVRHHGIFVGAACALGAVPAALMNRFYALPFLAVASIMTAVSIVYRRRMTKAAKAEQEALAAAGAKSYIGFHLQRVNGLLAGTDNRRRVAAAAEEHRLAVETWQELAGDIPVEWALTMRDRILATARRFEQEGVVTDANGTPSLRNVDPTDLAHSFVSRLADLRHAGDTGESLPVILDEPLSGVEASVKRWMLELVGRSAGTPQVVYLTEDAEVASWARMEAIAGHLAVIEPAPESETILDIVDRVS